MINYSWQVKKNGIKYDMLEFYNINKSKIFILAIIILLMLLTGIFTGIKLYNLYKSIDINDYSFVTLITNDIYSLSVFLKRFLSALLVMGLIILFSLNKYIHIFGYFLIAYRAFLLTMNCALIVMVLGIGGVIDGVLIILPCQLLMLILIGIIFIISINAFKQKKMYGKVGEGYYKWLIIFLLCAFIICVIESLLLIIFKPTTILIV